MDWNQAQPPQPVGPQNTPAPVGPVAPGSQFQPPFGNTPSVVQPAQGGAVAGTNPLQPQPPAADALPQQVPPATVPAFSSPLQPTVGQPVPMVPGAGMATPTAAMAPSANLDDDAAVSVDDAVWITRTKRAIAETRSDPHRQTQLIQQLRAQYLKQRFGRTIHTDEA